MEEGIDGRPVVLADEILEASADPVWFAQELLGAQPWSKQRDILTALRDDDFVAVRSCNGAGKTFTAALATLWWLCSHEEAMVITTAPTERQVRELLWREIRHLHRRNEELIGGRLSATRLEISDKCFAYGFSTNTEERFQGFHNRNMLAIVDEAAGVPEFIFDAIFGCLTSENSKILMIGNPSCLAGTFYDAFHKNRDHWNTIHISAFDTPAFQSEGENGISSGEYPAGIATPKWVQHIADQRGTNSAVYQFRVLGDFPDEADDTLIALRLIEAAAQRDFDREASHNAVMGVDVARFGSDKSVAVVRKGQSVIDIQSFGKSDLMQTAGRMVEIARRHGVVTMYVDEIGMGAGVIDRINELGVVQVAGVNSSSKARDSERYLNLRAQMFDGLRQRFADGEITIPDDPELISQLASLTYRFTSRGQLQIEGKDQIRSSGRQSPDKADALALAFVSDVDTGPLQMWILGG